MGLYGVIAAVCVGAAAGLVTRAVLPRTGVGGWIGDMMVGIFGASFGAFLVYSLSIGHTMYAPVFWYSAVGLTVAAGFLTATRFVGADSSSRDDTD